MSGIGGGVASRGSSSGSTNWKVSRPRRQILERILTMGDERRAIGDMKAGLTGRHGARPQLSILPRAGLDYGARAIEYGAAKYARGNYHGPAPAALGADAAALRVLGYVDAAMRHLTAVADAANRALGTGGDIAAALACPDAAASGGFPASGLPHLAHALASVLLGITVATDDGLLPADPGQPWVAALVPEAGLPQKDDPAAERARVAALLRARPEARSLPSDGVSLHVAVHDERDVVAPPEHSEHITHHDARRKPHAKR
jgi:hypothetical protein